jgi:hypothetical protein
MARTEAMPQWMNRPSPACANHCAPGCVVWTRSLSLSASTARAACSRRTSGLPGCREKAFGARLAPRKGERAGARGSVVAAGGAATGAAGSVPGVDSGATPASPALRRRARPPRAFSTRSAGDSGGGAAFCAPAAGAPDGATGGGFFSKAFWARAGEVRPKVHRVVNARTHFMAPIKAHRRPRAAPSRRGRGRRRGGPMPRWHKTPPGSRRRGAGARAGG